MDKVFFEVVVRCNTYNHSDFILDALNGFQMQKTTFPFLCIVMDDASTDGEQGIIRRFIEIECDKNTNSQYTSQETEYANIIFARHNTNKNCYFVFFLLKENHYQNGNDYKKLQYIKEWIDNPKYIALCEGDDYWTDSRKLQMQYDYMDNHSDCSLCHHDYKILRNGKVTERNLNIPDNQNLNEIANKNDVSTLTMFYRVPKEPIIPQNFNFKYPIYQFFLNLRLAEYGYIHYINKPMSIYRIHSGGIFSCQSEKRQYLMSMGNIHNMISWYLYGHPNSTVVKILRNKAKSSTKTYLIIFLKKGEIFSAFSILCWYMSNHRIFLGF